MARGYPSRLPGDPAATAARILGVADSYDAMTTTRAYRPRSRASRRLRN